MKTLTYTGMHFTIAFGVAWVLTGDLLVGGLVATVEPIINSIGYIIHEKLWRRHDQQKTRPLAVKPANCATC